MFGLTVLQLDLHPLMFVFTAATFNFVPVVIRFPCALRTLIIELKLKPRVKLQLQQHKMSSKSKDLKLKVQLHALARALMHVEIAI